MPFRPELRPRTVRDLHDQPFPSRRSAVLGTGGMVATSQPLAAQAGLAALRAGGNACDAAVTAVAALAVTEPTGTGLGGDCFALVYRAADRRVLALDGAGRAPAALSRELLLTRGHRSMPLRGALSVTVPGAVQAWATLLEAEGRRGLDAALAPAIRLAEEGYPVSELIAAAWRRAEPLLAEDEAARRHLLPGGRAPRPGERVRMPAMAATMRRVADEGPDGFYLGPVAERIAGAVQAAGGVLSAEDLSARSAWWREPLRVGFQEAWVWECPPPGQGLAALVALGVAEGLPLAEAGFGSARGCHLLVEALRLGFAEAEAHVGDPEHAPAPLDALLDEAYLAERRARIREDRAMAPPSSGLPGRGDTVYVAAVDEQGNACSLINSNYMGFGSGLVAGDTGIPLQNRGAGFTMTPGHPNEVGPGRRPFHTIIPSLLTRRDDDALLAVMGVMGGHFQAQGHLQVATNLLVHGMDPQRALDAPRVQITPEGRVALEPALEPARTGLARLGHHLLPAAETPAAGAFGGGQLIAIAEDGVRVGGSDPRKDGQAVCDG